MISCCLVLLCCSSHRHSPKTLNEIFHSPNFIIECFVDLHHHILFICWKKRKMITIKVDILIQLCWTQRTAISAIKMLRSFVESSSFALQSFSDPWPECNLEPFSCCCLYLNIHQLHCQISKISSSDYVCPANVTHTINTTINHMQCIAWVNRCRFISIQKHRRWARWFLILNCIDRLSQFPNCPLHSLLLLLLEEDSNVCEVNSEKCFHAGMN